MCIHHECDSLSPSKTEDPYTSPWLIIFICFGIPMILYGILLLRLYIEAHFQ